QVSLAAISEALYCSTVFRRLQKEFEICFFASLTACCDQQRLALYITFGASQKFLQKPFQRLAARSCSVLAMERTIAPFWHCFRKKLFSRSHQDGCG
ncbi:hypothetical protein, partial [Comamonas kerstersii]|uniref:hypothetical protein n=1 Tax=Comamonas kerstersii TaxID=225992 RepID=UPI0026DD079E